MSKDNEKKKKRFYILINANWWKKKEEEEEEKITFACSSDECWQSKGRICYCKKKKTWETQFSVPKHFLNALLAAAAVVSGGVLVKNAGLLRLNFKGNPWERESCKTRIGWNKMKKKKYCWRDFCVRTKLSLLYVFILKLKGGAKKVNENQLNVSQKK